MSLASIIVPLIGLAILVRHLDWVRRPPSGSLLAPVLAVVAFSLLGGLGLLPTITLSIFSGWAFGFAVGCPTAVLGLTGAGCVNFLLGRWLAGRQFLDAVDSHPRWKTVYRALLGCGERRAMLIVALLRVPTVPPYGATSIALAALNVRLRPFVVGSLLGVIPRTALYVMLAARLQPDKFDPGKTNSWWTLAVSAGATLAVLAVITILARRALKKLTAEEGVVP
jgi:uncharacterized membrane protein YdjX (TVP38/TMEM64 family)